MIELLLQADRLLTVDMVDQADAIYRKVAEADPHNAIAVVGMARCALARGDDHQAYRLAATALRIDPQNDMARRMEARLDEVLRTRGEVPGEDVQAAIPEPATQTPRPASRWPVPAPQPVSAQAVPAATVPSVRPVAAPADAAALADDPALADVPPSSASDSPPVGPAPAQASTSSAPSAPSAQSAQSAQPVAPPRSVSAAPAPPVAPTPGPTPKPRGLLDRLRGR